MLISCVLTRNVLHSTVTRLTSKPFCIQNKFLIRQTVSSRALFLNILSFSYVYQLCVPYGCLQCYAEKRNVSDARNFCCIAKNAVNFVPTPIVNNCCRTFSKAAFQPARFHLSFLLLTFFLNVKFLITYSFISLTSFILIPAIKIIFDLLPVHHFLPCPWFLFAVCAHAPSMCVMFAYPM